MSVTVTIQIGDVSDKDDINHALNVINVLAGIKSTSPAKTEPAEQPAETKEQEAPPKKTAKKKAAKKKAAKAEEPAESDDTDYTMFTPADIRDKLREVGQAKGTDVVRDILAEFIDDPSQRKVSNVPKDKYTQFVVRCNQEL